jgi:hypothetical protein
MSVSQFINEAKSAHDVILQQTRGLAAKWERSGLLEGLNGYDKQGMSVMLENQANQLINESSTTNPAGSGSPGENWAGVALPLVRKVFGSIASKNFVSVQPMNLPAGLVFYMDFKYGTTANGKTTGGSVYGLTSGSSALTGGLYGAGQFGYSINNEFLTGLTTTSASAATLADVNFNSAWSASVAAGTLKIYTVPVSSLTRPDLLSVRVFQPSGSGVNFGTQTLKEFTAVSGSVVKFVVNSATAGTIATVEYVTQPTDTTRGDFEDRTGSDLNIPEIDMELRSETIVAKTRKMKAGWSPELAQDLNSYHSVDAEAELTALLSEYISTEIDLEILDMLTTSADTTEYWSARVANIWNGTNAFVADTNLTAQAWTNMTWFQTLGQKMQKVSNIIHQKTMRGGANFAVISPTVATILETIPGFAADTNGDKMEFNAGVTKIGSFQNRFSIYKNPYMTENVMLLGYRGSQFLETGAVYAPYIPLIMTPLVLDPVNFTPRRGVMTRYAKKVLRPEFFGKILIADLNVV